MTLGGSCAWPETMRELEAVGRYDTPVSALPPAIGSPAWDRELREFGVLRADLDLLCELALCFARADRDRAARGEAAEDADGEDDGEDDGESGSRAPALTGHDMSLAPSQVMARLARVEAEDDGGGALWLHLLDEVLIDAERWHALERLRRLVAEQRVARRQQGEYGLARYQVMEAAAWLLFHESHPGYHAMMYLRHVFYEWRDAEGLLDWFARQMAALLVHGDAAIQESAEYSLGVDYFEDDLDATLILPRLLPLVTEAWRASILERSGYIAWEAKRDWYRQLAERPERHQALAGALRDSLLSAFFGTVDAREAFELVQHLRRQQPELLWASRVGRDLQTAFALPVLAWVASVICPRGAGQLAAGHRDRPPDAVLLLAFEARAPGRSPMSWSLPSWLDRSELYLDDARVAAVHTVRFSHDRDRPFLRDAAPEHARRDADPAQLTADPRGAGLELLATVQWHAVTMEAEHAPWSLLGRVVAIWPNRMYEWREQLPGRGWRERASVAPRETE